MRQRGVRGHCMLVLLFALAACHREGNRDTPGDAGGRIRVTTATVTTLSVPDTYEAVGTVQPAQASILESKIMGHVQEVLVREGDVVSANDLLVSIDRREPNLQVEQARAGLTQTEQSLRELSKAAEASRQSYEAALANEELAKITYDRVQGLAERGAVSRQALDEAEAKWKGATAEAARARETVLSYEAKGAEIRARIEASGAALEQSEVFAGHAEIRAPFAGVITRKFVDKGDLATPGVPLVAIEDTTSYRLEALVDENRIDRIAVDNAVSVRIDALGSESLSGRVIEKVPSGDSATRTFIVKVAVPARPEIRTGMFGRAEFTVGDATVLAVPRQAIFETGQLAGVYVVSRDTKAHMRLITVGDSFGDHVDVLSGLDEGDVVVSPIPNEIDDGSLLQVD